MKFRLRRIVLVFVSLLVLGAVIIESVPPNEAQVAPSSGETIASSNSEALQALESLQIKGRAPKTDYSREQFGSGWETKNGCDTRNIILNRDLENVKSDDACHVVEGTLRDPYTATIIEFKRGSNSSDVQIDHVVALSDAWQKGAQLLTVSERQALANDPLELLAVDGDANQAKSDGDAASWLPKNKQFRCQYVARQIAVKQKYDLWVTQAEHDAMKKVLSDCPGQLLP